MAKLTLSTITSGYNAVDALNDNFTAITAEFENVLSRDGTTPNDMEANLDMNSFSIINAASVAAQSMTINGQPVVANETFVTQLPDPAGQTDKVLRSDGAAPYWNDNTTDILDYTQGGTGSSRRVLTSKLQEVVSVLDFGAVGDGVTDDLAAIQAAIDSLVGKGGKIYFPSTGGARTFYMVSGPILLYSDIILIGDGWTSTFIKATNTATFTASQAVVMTADFTEDADLWDYYSPYPAGLHMGVGLRDITIDGNRANVANANGLMVYGGKWHFENLAVINTQGHGIWTEAGNPGSSTSGDDLHDFLNMHESFAENIYLSNNNKHGWLYRGPNDSYINNVQSKLSGWAGFYQDQDTTIAVGNLEVGTLHAYSAACGHDADGAMIHLYSALVGRLYVDSSRKNGVKFYGSASIADQVYTLFNNNLNAGNFYGVVIETQGVQVNQIRCSQNARTSGTNGGDVWIKNTAGSNVIGQIRSAYGSGSAIPSNGVVIEASDVQVGDALISGFNVAGSVGLTIGGSMVSVNGGIKSCDKGLQYNNSGTGRNRLRLAFVSNTTDYAASTTVSDSDMFDWTSDKVAFNQRNIGLAKHRHINNQRQLVNYAATIALNAAQNSNVRINTLTGNLTMDAPTNPVDGDMLHITFQQDGTGGRTITWNSVFKTNYSDTGNTAFKRASLSFQYNSSNSSWEQIGGFSGWF